MFELLMELPLFQGVTRERMAQTVGAAKFHFLKYPAGETVFTAGTPATHISFVLSGKVRTTIVNSSGRFAVSSTITGPDVIAPAYLFGRITNYPCTVVAEETTSILQISKADYIKILYSDQVFMFNFLNYLSVNSQKALDGILALTDGDLDERIAYWVICLSQPGSDDITLTCRQRDLCSIFGAQRSQFTAALESMAERGLIEYTPTELHVLNRRRMLDLLRNQPEPTHHDEPISLPEE